MRTPILAPLALAAALGAPAALLSQAPAPRPPLPPRAVVAARVDSVVRAAMAERGLASVSVAVVRGGDTLVRRAWGMADLDSKRVATEATTYRIGSVSKQFTAALVLRLVDRGRLALTDSIGHYLAGLRPEWRPLRIEQILNHTSGLQREFRQATRGAEHLRAQDQPTDTLVAWARRDTMVAAPGTRYVYSNTGYLLLGALVEKLYGRPYGAVLRDEIARPLGLASLGWCADADMAATAVTGYHRLPSGKLDQVVFMHPSLSLGAGGICASARDLAAWNRALHGGRVLSPASYAAMTTPRGAAAGSGYGFGIGVRPTAWGTTVMEHSGATPGYLAENAWYPAESLSVTILYNTTPPPAGGGIAPAVARVALGLPAEVPVRTAAAPGASPAPTASQAPLPVSKDAAPALDGLAGEYELGPGRVFTITLENGTLYALPPGRPKRTLVWQSGTTFLVQGAEAQGDVTLTFARGADGRATSLTIRQPGGERTLPKVK